jgi:hypothetical protein
MALWGSRDFASGNNKPLWANTANVYGVDVTEAQAANNRGRRMTSGWVEFQRGRGYINGISITNAGSNITSAGFVTLNGGNFDVAANISFGINNVSNTVNTVTIVRKGEGYLNTPNAYVVNTGFGFAATFTLTMGGRFGRNVHETLVVVKNMTGDADADVVANT